MNAKTYNRSWDLYINGTKIKRYYSLSKAISIGEIKSQDLFIGHVHVEVINSYTGEIVWNS